MAGKGRKHADNSGERKVVRPSKKYFFLEGKLLRVVEIVRATDTVYFHYVRSTDLKAMRYSDFKKHRKRAYTQKGTADLLGRSVMQITRYIKAGMIEPPTYVMEERKFGGNHNRSFYSEDYIFEIRDMMANIPMTYRRKDGIIKRNVLTEQELRVRMGLAMMLYAQTEDGRFIPVWNEEIN